MARAAVLFVGLFVSSASAMDCATSFDKDLGNTAREILIGAGWATAGQCDNMTPDTKRNTIIFNMYSSYSNDPVNYYQGLNDNDLQGTAALTITLLKEGFLTKDYLKQKSADDHRNYMIVILSERKDMSVSSLQAKNNWDLVNLAQGWYHQYCQVAAILSLTWNLDEAKIVDKKPDILTQETYDNSNSSIPLNFNFEVSKSRTETSTFSHEHGVQFGEKLTTTAGIPLIASETIEISSEQKDDWKLGSSNSQTTSFKQTSPESIPPGKKIQLIAQVSSSHMDVGYHAQIKTSTGELRDISGVWHGVGVYNLVVVQKDLLVEAASVDALVV